MFKPSQQHSPSSSGDVFSAVESGTSYGAAVAPAVHFDTLEVSAHALRHSVVHLIYLIVEYHII